MSEMSDDGESSDRITLLRDLEAEREQMTNEIFNMRLRINFLEEKLLMHEAGNDMTSDEKDEELIRLMSANKAQSIDLAEKDNLLEYATHRLQSHKETINELRAEKSLLETQAIDPSQVDSLRAEKERLIQKESLLQEQLGLLREETAKQTTQLMEYKVQCDYLRQSTQQVAEMEEKIETFRQQISENQMKICQLESSCVSKEDQITRLKETLSHERELMGKGQEKALTDMENMQKENNQLQMHIRELKDMNVKEQAARVELQQEQEVSLSLKRQLSAQETKMAALEDSLGHERLNFQDLTSKERQRYESIEEEYSKLQSKCQLMEQKLTQFETNEKEMARRLQDEQKRSDQYRTAQSESLTRHSEYESVIRELTAQLNDLKTQLQTDTHTACREQLKEADHQLLKEQEKTRNSQLLLQEWQTGLKRQLELTDASTLDNVLDAIHQRSNDLQSVRAELQQMQEKCLHLQELSVNTESSEIRHLQDTISQYKKDLEGVKQQLKTQEEEKRVFQTQCEEAKKEMKLNGDYTKRLGENNRVLILELEEKREIADAATKQCSSVIKENNHLLMAMTNLKNQVKERDNQLDYYVSKFQELSVHSEKDRMLQHMVDTRQMMQDSCNQIEQGREGVMIERLEVILRDVDKLIRRSGQHVDQLQNSNMPTSKIERDTEMLVNGNMRLSNTVKRLAQDIDMYLRAEEQEPTLLSPRKFSHTARTPMMHEYSPPTSPETPLSRTIGAVRQHVGAARLHTQFRDQHYSLQKLGMELRSIDEKLKQSRDYRF